MESDAVFLGGEDGEEVGEASAAETSAAVPTSEGHDMHVDVDVVAPTAPAPAATTTA